MASDLIEPPTAPINLASADVERSLEELLFDSVGQGPNGIRERGTSGIAPLVPLPPALESSPAIQPIPASPRATNPGLAAKPPLPPPRSSPAIQPLAPLAQAPLPPPQAPPPQPAPVSKSQASGGSAPAVSSSPQEKAESVGPGNILIVDDDARAGSLVATRLLELGYGCLVAKSDLAARALAKGRFDAVVLEVPLEDARRDAGASRLAALGAPKVPVILTSPAVLKLDQLRRSEGVSAALTKPYFVEVLVQAIESARGSSPMEGALAPAPKPSRAPGEDSGEHEPGKDRMSELRYELDVNVVRALVSGGPDGQPARGRVKNIALRGAITIETQTRFAPRTPMTVECQLLDGKMMMFTGGVLRSSAGELAIRLDCDDTQRQFLDMFVTEARAPNQRALPAVRISERVEGTTEDIIDDMALMRCWLEVSDKLDNDDDQQRFIQMCLRAERLEFGIARYRELKAQRPDDERIPKYLQQIGTILGFYALSKKDVVQEKVGMPRIVKLAIALFAIAAIAVALILHRVMK